MNQIHYFAHESGMYFAAVAPGSYRESLTFAEHKGRTQFAKIDLGVGDYFTTGYFEVVENGFVSCSRETYLTARRKAQNAIAEFFGEFEQFQTPPVPAHWRELDPELMQGFLTR